VTCPLQRGLNLSQSCFYSCSKEIVKRAAIKTVLLLQQYPLSVAENFAVAVCNINAVLFEKQQQLLTQAEKAPLKLPPPLLQPNACNFPTSRKRKITVLKAAL
jgi:hypothetical protein